MRRDTQTPTPISIPNHPSPKPRRSKTREVSSRFLSPSESPLSSPSQTLSPIQHRKPPPTSTAAADSRKHHSLDDRKLWPSTASKTNKLGTLADHLGNDRLKDLVEPAAAPHHLARQRSCSEVDRFEKETNRSCKENHRPSFGGSMRYTGRKLMGFPKKGKSSSSPDSTTSSKSSSSSSFSNIVPRLSVDANNFNCRRNSDSFADLLSSESEYSDYGGNGKNSSTYLASTASSRRLAAGVEVSSRYLNDAVTKQPRRGSISTSQSACSTPDNAPTSNILPPKSMMKRANSYKSTISQWALSPGRTGSPPMSVENKGKPILSFSSLRPPHSPSRSKGVGNLFSMGLELFKSKKSSSSSSPVRLGHGVGESMHQLRMWHNRLIQWRYINAKASIVNENKKIEAEKCLLKAMTTISTLQASVIQKRIQFRKEKLQFKLNNVLKSQVKPLESWGDMERQHTTSLSTTTDCLHSIVCRVPLIEGAKADPQQISLVMQHAVDFTASLNATLVDFSPEAQKECEYLTELCDVVTKERQLLEECFNLISLISILETQEKSLHSSLVQLKSQDQQQCLSRIQKNSYVMFS